MVDLIVKVALLCSIVSFVAFIWLLARQAAMPTDNPTATAARDLVAKAVSADDLAKILDSFTKLVESLKNASPTLLAFASSILFLLVAVLQSGVSSVLPR